MGYRLLEVSSFYKKYLERFYKDNLNIDSLSYDEHYQLLVNDGFAECDFIHPELKRLGVDSKLVIYNDEKLQRKWNQTKSNDSLFDILCNQILDFKPDVIFFSDMTLLNKEEYSQINSITKNLCKFVGWHFTVVNDVFKSVSGFFDQVYTGSKYILTLLKPYCTNVKLVYHGFSSSLLTKIQQQDRENKIVFPGSIFIGEEIHNNRIDMFEKLYEKNIQCDFFGCVYGSFIPTTLKQYVKWILNINRPSKSRINIEKKIKENLYPSVFGLEYYKVLAKYSICLNQHAAIAGTGAGNMRMFEATGMGACLLTDYRDENIDLFIPDEEIVVYKNYDELIEKATYLIENPEVAYEIGKRGQQRTLNTHSYSQKAEMINKYILELFE